MSKYFGKSFGPSTRAPKFLTQTPQLFIIKICFAIKINSICGAGRDTWNLHHKYNSQGPALRILGLRVIVSKNQGHISRILGVRVPCSRVQVPGSRVSGSCFSVSQSPRVRRLRVPGLRVPRIRVPGFKVLGSRMSGPRVPGSEPQVLILDYAYHY